MKSRTMILLISWSVICLSIIPSLNLKNVVVGQDPDHRNYEQFSLDEGSTHYVMSNFSIGQTWEVNCTAIYKGEFHLFLFDERPLSNFLLDDGSIDDDIYNHAEIYNTTPASVFSASINSTVYSTTLTYTATNSSGETDTSLYYIQIFCVSGGPDTYILTSNFQIQPYYIPFISSYPIGVVSILILSSFAWIYKKKKKNMNNH